MLIDDKGLIASPKTQKITRPEFVLANRTEAFPVREKWRKPEAAPCQHMGRLFVSENNMNAIEVFEHKRFGEVRIIDQNGKPWFVGNDVAKALGYADANRAVRDHCKGGCVLPVPSDGGIQQMKIIPEADLFRLIMHSKLPDAEAFQDWVVEEVLPSIRERGEYNLGKAREVAVAVDALIAVVKRLELAQEKQELLEEREAIFGNRTPYGAISKITGLPRTEPTRGYLHGSRAQTTITSTTVTERQLRLFDWE